MPSKSTKMFNGISGNDYWGNFDYRLRPELVEIPSVDNNRFSKINFCSPTMVSVYLEWNCWRGAFDKPIMLFKVNFCGPAMPPYLYIFSREFLWRKKELEISMFSKDFLERIQNVEQRFSKEFLGRRNGNIWKAEHPINSGNIL